MKRATLPTALPLQAKNLFVLGDKGRHRYYHTLDWQAPKTDDEPLPPPPEPPVFAETLEEVSARVEALVAPLKLNESLAQPHPMTLKLLSGDERRASKGTLYVSSWNQPKFRHPSGKELLTALNRLFHAWTSLGAEVSVDGQINQSIYVDVLGRSLPLGVLDYGWDGNGLDPRFKPGGRFGLYWEHPYNTFQLSPKTLKSYREYDQFSADILRSLLVESVVLAETAIRHGQQWEYERIIESREKVIREREERRLAAIKRRQEEIQKLRQTRRSLAEEAVERISRADRLRDLIQAFDAKMDSAGQPVASYEQWRQWAVQYADEIDPRSMSVDQIERWIAAFRLDEYAPFSAQLPEK